MSKKSTKEQNYEARKELDYQYGQMMENRYKVIIYNYFNIEESETNKTTHTRYSVIDWTIKNKKTKEVIQIELKSRSNDKTQYKDTMYNFNKFIKQIDGLRNNKITKAYAVFLFNDEVAFYEITQDSLNDKIRIDEGGRSDRGVRESSLYAYIDISLLKTIKTFKSENKSITCLI